MNNKQLGQRLLIMLIAGLIVGLSFGIVIGGKIVRQTGKVWLQIQPKPNWPNIHPELDTIANDTAYINWYTNK